MKKRKDTVVGDVMETVTKYFLIAIAIVALFVLLSGLKIVETGNVALVLRFGELVGDNYEEQVHEPGLMFSFPYFIDEVVTVSTGQVMEQTVNTYYTEDGTRLQGTQGGYIITGDQNVAVLAASVKYSITDPVAYTKHVKDINSLVNNTVSTAMLNEGARMDVDDLLTSGKDDFVIAVRDFANEKLAMMQTGVTISSVELTQVAAPEEVRDTFAAVTAASVSAETMVQRANTYHATLIPEAQTEANTTLAASRTNYNKEVSAANAYLVEFWGIANELAGRREAIYADNAEAHGHGETVPEGDAPVCATCEGEFRTLEKLIKTRVHNEKYQAAINQMGQIYLVKDGEVKIILKP